MEISRDIILEIREQVVVAILGPSGCGKSTLLRAILGLGQPSSGQIFHRGHMPAGVNLSVAFAFHSFALFSWLTMQQNVAVGLPILALDWA